MLIKVIAGISLILLIFAVFFALRMIAITGRRKAWIFLSIGIATMGVRRLLSFIYLLTGGPGDLSVLSTELKFEIVGLLGSAIMLGGIILIRPAFLSIKRSEEELRRSEDFIKTILETVDEAFVVLDPEYRIMSANKAYLEQVNMPLENAIGKHCYEVSHHLSKPCHETGMDCAVRQTFITGRPHAAVHTHSDSEGNPLFAESKSYPVKDSLGKIVSVIETITDITEKRKIEERLRQGQKLEAIGQLAGGISHDFNNMLTAIIGYGNILNKKMEKDSPLKPLVDQILSSAEKSADLTRQLLAFSRKQIISPRQVDLNGLIKGMDNLLQRVIGEDIELKTILSDSDLPLMADPGQIEQVLINLLANARDAMPNGGTLSVTTEKVYLDGEYCKTHDIDKPCMYALISVSDNGAGMDEKTRQRIFEPFFTTKELGKGTGLGLSLAYGIVRQHNGNISVFSETGEGTTFEIYLPLIKLPVTDEIVSKPIVPEGGTETILIAEDNDDVRVLTKKVLEGYGYQVIEAVDGEDAVKVFQQNKDRIQLLLLDVILPKKSGKEVGDEIKKINSDIRVLFMSGYTADVICRKGILEGETDFISKPVTSYDLLIKLREILNKAA